MIRSQRQIREVELPAQQLSQTEKLLLRYETTRDWVQGNPRMVAAAAVVLVAIVGGLWWWAGQRKANADHAATYLSRVLNQYYFAGDYRHSIDGDRTQKVSGEPLFGLRYIADQYGSTSPGREAMLLLGNSYYALGKYDSASRYFNDASSDYPLVKASIEAGRAAIFEHGSNKIEAAKLFEQAAGRDDTNPLAADYLLSAARDYEGAGQKDDAVRLYRKIVADYPSTQFDDAAKRELLKMNVEL